MSLWIKGLRSSLNIQNIGRLGTSGGGQNSHGGSVRRRRMLCFPHPIFGSNNYCIHLFYDLI